MILVALDHGEPRYTLMRADGVTEHDRTDILHIKAMSPDGLLGLSPIQMCRQTLSLTIRSTSTPRRSPRTRAASAACCASLAGAPRSPARREHVREDWESNFVGLSRSGNLLMLAGEDDVHYTQLSLSMVDVQFVEQTQMRLHDLCRIFRVPPHLVAVSTGERMTYTNIEMEGRRVPPLQPPPVAGADRAGDQPDPDLSPATQWCRFDVDELLRSDTAGRATAYYSAALNPQTGWLSRDEVRALEGYPLAGEN